MPAKNGTTWKTKSIWPDIRNTLKGYDKIIVFDLETTGLFSIKDRIIEIAAVKYKLDDTYHQYINQDSIYLQKLQIIDCWPIFWTRF